MAPQRLERGGLSSPRPRHVHDTSPQVLQPLEEVTFARFSRLAAASAASAAPGGAPAGADEATLRELQLLLRGAVAARDDELTHYTSQQQSAFGASRCYRH